MAMGSHHIVYAPETKQTESDMNAFICSENSSQALTIHIKYMFQDKL